MDAYTNAGTVGLQFGSKHEPGTAGKKGKKQEQPASLTLAIADNGTGLRKEAIAPVAAYLSKELGISVRATATTTAIELLNGLKEGSIDIAYINGFGYVLGVSDSLPLVPLVVPGTKDGSPNTYNSCIFTAATSSIKSMADLVSRAQQYRFLFVNPTSTSGHLVPRLYLGKMGIKQAEVELKDVAFGDSHYNTIEQVLAGEADAGATAYNIVQARLASGELRWEDINILWVSENITQEPVVVSERMAQPLQKKAAAGTASAAPQGAGPVGAYSGEFFRQGSHQLCTGKGFRLQLHPQCFRSHRRSALYPEFLHKLIEALRK
ncbi:phosphate/phosphite/phosphonate ABC transporter substrate-binding protein, partial [Cesiribacter andamanensis]|uniref:phosphate/phosphite/phosphonate ABC transporter substrate-binding protein n=1 Tax=Cesiribacter andamanensis TaxID=649507 RepID=UPI00058E3AB5